MSHWNSDAHYKRVKLCQSSHQGLEIALCLVPVIIFIHHEKVLIVGVKQSLSLAVILTTMSLFFEFVLNLLSLVSSDINRVASFALTVLAALGWKSSSSLQSRNLAQAAL